MRILCGTWNIQGADPGYVSKEDIQKWLHDSILRQSARNPRRKSFPNCAIDIYAIGFQEIIPMDKSVEIPVPKVIISGADNLDLSRIDIRDKVIFAWANRLLYVINSFERSPGYSLYGAFMFNGIAMFIITRKDLVSRGLIRNSLSDAVRADDHTSALQLFKLPDNNCPGAVAIRFDCGGSSFAFVCAHMTGGEGINACSTRNAQYRKISSELFQNQGLKLSNHEYVFWFGDLNYRICPPSYGSFTPSHIWDLVKRKELKKLLQADELILQRRTGVAFQGYQEGFPNFQPTYKYASARNRAVTPKYAQNTPAPPAGNQQYDELPAWTDRILWRRLGNETSKDFHGILEAYALANIYLSEHRPVAALIDVQVPDPRLACSQPATSKPAYDTTGRSRSPYRPMVSINKRSMSPGPLQSIVYNPQPTQPGQAPQAYTLQQVPQPTTQVQPPTYTQVQQPTYTQVQQPTYTQVQQPTYTQVQPPPPPPPPQLPEQQPQQPQQPYVFQPVEVRQMPAQQIQPAQQMQPVQQVQPAPQFPQQQMVYMQ